MSDDPDESCKPVARDTRAGAAHGRTGPGCEQALVVLAAGGRVVLPLAAIRRIEPARVAWMPTDPSLGTSFRRAVVGMIVVHGVVHGVVSLSILLGGVQGPGPGARILCLGEAWLARAGPGSSGLLRQGLALMVDGVVDMVDRADGEAGAVLDLAAVLDEGRSSHDARDMPS